MRNEEAENECEQGKAEQERDLSFHEVTSQERYDSRPQRKERVYTASREVAKARVYTTQGTQDPKEPQKLR